MCRTQEDFQIVTKVLYQVLVQGTRSSTSYGSSSKKKITVMSGNVVTRVHLCKEVSDYFLLIRLFSVSKRR